MNHSNALSMSLLGALSASVALADNPVISHRSLADPNAFVFNNRIYAMCSNDDDNVNGYDMKSAVVISTSDLVNWTDHGDVFRVTREAKWAQGSYAPTAVAAKGKVYMYFPAITAGTGVLVADKPEGPYKDPLGKALISGKELLCDMGWCFDPVIFVDDDTPATAYVVWGGGTPYGNNFRGVALNADMISLKGESKKISVPNSFEGPFVHKYKGNYYLHYPINPNSNLEYAMSSTSPISGYTRKGVVLPNPSLNGQNINQGNNSHASIIEWKGSWYMMYHDRRLFKATHKRNVSIDKLEYNADGTMKQVVVTAGMAQVGAFNPYDSIPAATMSKQSGIKAMFNATTWINYLVPQSSGSWIRISGVDFKTGAKEFQVKAATTASNVNVEVRTGSETGALAGTCAVTKTSSNTTVGTSTCTVTGLTGVKDLFLKFTGTTANAYFVSFKFVPDATTVIQLKAIEAIRNKPTTTAVFDLRGTLVRQFAGELDATRQAELAKSLPVGAYVTRLDGPEGVRYEKFARAVR